MTTNLANIGSAVRTRRDALGLSQQRLAHLSGLSRQTLSGLENGTLQDLGFNRVAQVLSLLGLNAPPPTTQARDRKHGLWMAAKTASVSYKRELDADTLAHALATGNVPDAFLAHVAKLLEEAPLPIVVMAVEETAHREQVKPQHVWRNVAKLAKDLELSRQDVLA